MLNLTIRRSPAVLPPTETDRNIEVWRDVEGTICAYGQIIGEERWMHLPGVASFRLARHDREPSVAFTNTAEDALVREAYHRRVLPMALHLIGKEVMHASGVRSDTGVIAFCGPSQTGKSTIACGVSQRGHALWADDAVAFGVSFNGARTSPLPFEMRLRTSAASLLGGCCSGDQSRKAVQENSKRKSAPLRAVCVLRRNDNDATTVSIKQLFSSDALEAVLPHAWCFTLQDVQRKRRMMSTYLELVAKTAILNVCFRPGLENLPAILDAIESQLKRITSSNGSGR